MQRAQSKYGDIIHKEPMQVFIQTSNQKITGTIHVIPHIRLKDNLDRNEDTFIVVTEASLSGIDKEFAYILVQRSEIVWLAPLEEERETHKLKGSIRVGQS